MQRAPRKVAALAVALSLAGALAPASPAAAAPTDLPSPADGGPAELLRFTGDPSSATGNALADGSCDVDGDGYADLIAGAWFWDKAPTGNIGATYVVFGGPDVQGAALADPGEVPTGAVRIDGPATANAFTGFAVGCLGDVDGDGIDDLAISHYTAQRTYVVFGAEAFTGLTLDAMGDRGFTVAGGPASGNVGYSLAPVGDIDADGLDDFAVAEVAADTLGRTNNGRVWVLAGRDDITDVDLLAPADGQVLLTVDGALSEERLGTIAGVGDVNGDEVDDFLLGAYTSTPWGSGVAVPGAAYVVFGGTTGAVDTAALGDDGFTIVGPKRQRDRLGISVAGAGDIDGDGLADLVVGADGVSNATTGPRNGGAAVVFGSPSNATVLTDPAATSGQSVFTCPDQVSDPGACVAPVRRGYWIDGATAGDSTGFSVAGLGDVTGDGTADLALGAYGFDPANPEGGTLSGAGALHVVAGDPDAVVQSLSSPDQVDGFRLDGTAAGDRFGRQVASLGDVDGNGVDDLAVGADFAARGAAQNGEVTVALMGTLATTTTLTGPSTAMVDADATFTATVAKPAGAPTPISGGSVAFARGGAAVEGCEEVPVLDGTATCTTSFGSAGPGEVTATFSGTDALQGSSATPHPFTVDAPSTADEAWALAAYEDFLGRPPSDAELQDVLARLTAGAPRRTIARELATSPEWIEVSIRRFYVDTLGRQPDAAGLAYWVRTVASGSRSLESVGAQFYASAEHYRKAGGTDEAWVTDLYAKLLGRQPDPDGLSFWSARTASRGRLHVATQIYGSPESRRDRVAALYDALLDRAPDPSGLAYWSARIASTGDLELAVHLATSSEYGTRALVRFP